MAGHSLSADELFKQFCGPERDLPSRGGAKDYAPDGSWLQAKRLEHFHNERREILLEERVRKRSHLGRCEWRPDIGKAEIVGKVSKFWQKRGHVEGRKYYLYPEEALSLLEMGDLEVFYGGLPLSVQEAYPTLLGGGRVPIEQYQVYSHLSRYGYTLLRHKPVESYSQYERQLGIERGTPHESRRDRKRKAKLLKQSGEKHVKPDTMESQTEPELSQCAEDDSVRRTQSKDLEDVMSSHEQNISLAEDKNPSVEQDNVDFSRSNHQKIISDDEMEMEVAFNENKSSDYLTNSNKAVVFEGGTRHNKEFLTCHSFTYCQNNLLSDEKMTVISEGSSGSDEDQSHHPLGYSNFSDIQFPSLSPDGRVWFPTLSPEGDSSSSEIIYSCFIPEGVDFTPQSEHTSQTFAWKRAPRETTAEFSFGDKFNQSGAIATNWAEYKERSHGLTGEDILLKSPVGHLWQGDVKPLVTPADALSTGSLLDRMKLIQNIDLAWNSDRSVCTRPRLPTCPAEIVYDVYQSETGFAKTDPGLPTFRVCVFSQDSLFPDLADMARVWRQSSDGVPVQWAVVDGGDVSFYSFNSLTLPDSVCLH